MINSSPSIIHTAVLESIAGSIILDYPDSQQQPKRRGLAVTAWLTRLSEKWPSPIQMSVNATYRDFESRAGYIC
jgi:hypothetical protein